METDEILKDLNEQQKEAVQFKDGQLIIFAGAGTGKTKVITQNGLPNFARCHQSLS
jgi:ATP-dependent exoDNAse (exonuclease V) beta subunit